MSVLSPIKLLRPIKSFIIRSGRMSPEQKETTVSLYEKYGLGKEQTIVARDIFGREAPLIVEVGFGMSHSLIEMASRRPEADFIGIEVHPPGIARALSEIERLGLTNLRVIQHDAMEVLGELMAPQSLDEVWLLFPDPWPKNKHHKRRIVQAPFIELVTQRLKVGGHWTLATDWAPYAKWMVQRLEQAPGLKNVVGPGCTLAPEDKARIQTKFERRGEGLGYTIYDYRYLRI